MARAGSEGLTPASTLPFFSFSAITRVPATEAHGAADLVAASSSPPFVPVHEPALMACGRHQQLFPFFLPSSPPVLTTRSSEREGQAYKLMKPRLRFRYRLAGAPRASSTAPHA